MDHLTFDQKLAAQGHVLYELGSLAELLHLLVQLEDVDDPDPIVKERHRGNFRNATLEALLVHVRCLIEFLIGRPPFEGKTARRRSDRDIPPTWFAPSWKTPEGPQILDQWLDLIDSQLSHLSQTRIRFAEDGEPDPVVWTGQMLIDLLVELDRFRDHLGGSDYRPGIALAIDRLRAELHIAASGAMEAPAAGKIAE